MLNCAKVTPQPLDLANFRRCFLSFRCTFILPSTSTWQTTQNEGEQIYKLPDYSLHDLFTY